MTRAPGPSVRLKLTLSYAGLVVLAGALLLAVVWVFLLRYVPKEAVQLGGEWAPGGRHTPGLFVPGRDDLVNAFLPKAAIAMAVLLLFGLVGGWLLAGRMLAPLSRITDATRRAGGGSLGHRIHLEGRRDEFRDLADTFDAMLARLEAHVEEQRRFAANASHELRTPLAVTQTLLEVAREDPDRDVDALVDRLHVVNTRAIDLTQALLLLTRADQAFTPERVDLSLVVEEAAETLLPLAEKHGLTLEVVSDHVAVGGSPVLLLQLATNLVHNAIVHNTGPGGRISVTTRLTDQGARPVAELRVENTGEPLEPALVATLTEPFQRGTARVRGDHAGVGLGLAIAQRVVEAHGGSLLLEPRTGGGLVAIVRLPALGPSAA